MNYCFLIGLVQIKDKQLATLWFKIQVVESMDRMRLEVLLETNLDLCQKLLYKMISFFKKH